MTSHWKAVLGVILIYLFGCFSGVVSTSIFFHHKLLEFLKHPSVAELAVLEKQLTGNLGLDEDQKKQVHACFLENLEQRKELQKQIQPQVQALNQQTRQQITAILHPGQVELFNQNIEKFRKHWAPTAFNQNAENPSSPPVQPAGAATNSGAGQPPTSP
jgi:LPS O-antigen subunit length determinant protein (WzzB/FepE family)